jgi:hypothetical protein
MSDNRIIAATTAALQGLLASAGPGAAVTLYRITPNMLQRNRRPGGGLQAPAAVVDLHYAISFRGDDMQRQLGVAIAQFSAVPVLSGTMIDGYIADPSLHGALLPTEALQIVPETLSLVELSAVFQALGQPLQPAIFYTIGPLQIS